MNAEHPNSKIALPPGDIDRPPRVPASQEPELPASRGEGELEVSPRLLREWGPLLKPTGIGLLLALHSFEESAPAHPFLGWAHCTQNALASYLDTSQDTIARYTGLLLTCGLLAVDEVETGKGKQKLYRVSRGSPLPSIALLEHLIFDADGWTRKHAAWLLDQFIPLDSNTELARMVAVLKRAYSVRRDARGMQALVSGERLTPASSYLARRATAVQSRLPGELSPAPRPRAAAGGALSASCGEVAEAATAGSTDPHLASTGLQPAHESSSCGRIDVMSRAAPVQESAQCGQASESQPRAAETIAPGNVRILPAEVEVSPSAPCGQPSPGGASQAPDYTASCGSLAEESGNVDAWPSAPCGEVKEAGRQVAQESAPCGDEASGRTAQMIEESAGCGIDVEEHAGQTVEESAQRGLDAGPGGSIDEDSARCGVAAGANVNVDRLPLRETYNENDNVTASAPARGELDEVLLWGTSVLGDGDSLDWHRRCVARWGIEAYRQAIATTQRALAGGNIANPGAYFTGVLRRSGHSPASSAAAKPDEHLPRSAPAPGTGEKQQNQHGRAAALPQVPASLPESVPSGSPSSEAANLNVLWQAALVNLRVALPRDDYDRILRYATLLELDRLGGWALLGLPNEYLAEQVRTRLAAAIKAVLSQVCGTTVDVAATALPGQGPLAGGAPTLAEMLGNRGS